MNEDFRDLLDALLRAEAMFLVVGAHAMAVDLFASGQVVDPAGSVRNPSAEVDRSVRR